MSDFLQSVFESLGMVVLMILLLVVGGIMMIGVVIIFIVGCIFIFFSSIFGAIEDTVRRIKYRDGNELE